MWETRTFKVSGITCASCVLHIADSVKRLPGTRKVSGSLATNTVKVSFDPDGASVQQIAQAIEGAGYAVEGDRVAYVYSRGAVDVGVRTHER